MARRKAVREDAQPQPSKVTPAREPKAKPVKSGLVLSGVPRVNLLPPSELERRATLSLLKRWVIAVLATAVVVSGVVIAANGVRAVASLELAAEHNRTLTLNAELASFADVSRALAEQAELTTYRGNAMGNDIEWRDFFKTLTSAVPDESDIRDFTLVAGANPVEGADPAIAIGLIGRLTLATTDPQDVARMVKQLRELGVTLAADTGSLSTAGEDGYTYTVEFVVNQTPYSGRLTSEAGPR